jgi:hypothetical protein
MRQIPSNLTGLPLRFAQEGEAAGTGFRVRLQDQPRGVPIVELMESIRADRD